LFNRDWSRRRILVAAALAVAVAIVAFMKAWP